MVVVFKNVVLWDLFSGIVCEGMDGEARSIIEQQDFPEARDIELFDRLNVAKSFGFTATREFKDEDTAELFYHTHPEQILGKGPLLMMGTFKTWQRFYNVAACERVSPRVEGCRAWMTYSFLTGLSSIKP